MTKKLIIKNKAGVQTHGATSDQFDSLESFEAWKQNCIDSNVWGLPERPELDEMGEPTGVILPSEYEVVIEDITQEIEAEKKAKADKEKRKKDRKDSRKVIDWSKNPTTKQLQEIVKTLVEEIEV